MISAEVRYALEYGIKKTESGGEKDPWRARSPLTKYGYAWGAFQVLEGNIGPWTEECISDRLTLEEFLEDREAQILTAGCKMQQSYERYGTIEDAFSVHFSGLPAKGNYNKDVTGTSVPTYITRTLNYLGI